MDDPVWSLSRKALGVADDVYYNELKTISVEGYSDGVFTEQDEQPVVADRTHREVYADSLFDLQRLLEEVRFEIALATMLTSDYRARHPLDEPAPPSAGHQNVTIPAEVLAVLASYAGPVPSPSVLATDLHRAIPGSRHLSRWLAAQLLDSAMLRSLSVLDRVVTMLYIRAGLTIRRGRDGSLRLPNFSIDQLKKIRSAYEEHPAWPGLREVARDEMYAFIKRYRDGNVHHRRWPSELHGETSITYWDTTAKDDEPRAERRQEGLTAQLHIAAALAAWNHVLRPAVEAGARLASSGQVTAERAEPARPDGP
jgi:hypothetical protein